jgi:hypothetical protein
MEFGSDCLMRRVTFLNPNIIQSIRGKKTGWARHKPYVGEIMNLYIKC